MNLYEWIAAIVGLVLGVGAVYAIGYFLVAVFSLPKLFKDDDE